MHRLWDSGFVGDEHVCDVHVSNLRHKVERDPSQPSASSTVRGVGYKLVAAAKAGEAAPNPQEIERNLRAR